MVNFFGYKFVRDTKEKTEEQNKQAFSEPNFQDGALETNSSLPGFYGFGINFDTTSLLDNEIKLINKYRELALQPEIEKTIDTIVNEAFAYDENDIPVEINLDEADLPRSLEKKIRNEFDSIMEMLDFRFNSYDIFKRWYVDGRIYYHKIIDLKNPEKGILELRYIDPRKIKKIREKRVSNRNPDKNPARDLLRNSLNQVPITEEDYIEYFIYNPAGLNFLDPKGLKIATDTITYIHSGILDVNGKVVLSHLHRAIKPFNQLKMLEDSLVIYRLTRAPERRVFNIEVGNLPKSKAEQHVKDIMNRFRRKTVYDPETGNVRDDKRYMTMLEDFWFPKRDGKGTTVDQLPGAQNLGDIEDVEYFKKKLYEALGIPLSRLDSNTPFNMGRTSEITRDELQFSKFVTRLRKRFSKLFEDILGTQLLLKKIVNKKEWEKIKKNIYYDFLEDNFFTELKWADIWTQRFNSLRDVEAFEGKYFSLKWVRKNILKMTEEEIDEMDAEIEKEKAAGKYDPIGPQPIDQDVPTSGEDDQVNMGQPAGYEQQQPPPQQAQQQSNSSITYVNQ